MADDTRQLQSDIARVREDVSLVRERTSVLAKSVEQKVDRSEWHDWKEALFERVTLEIGNAFDRQAALENERRKIFGHETAGQISKAIADFRADVDRRLEDMSKAIKHKADKSYAEPHTAGVGFNIDRSWILIGGILFGALFGNYVLPALVRFAATRLMGG